MNALIALTYQQAAALVFLGAFLAAGVLMLGLAAASAAHNRAEAKRREPDHIEPSDLTDDAHVVPPLGGSPSLPSLPSVKNSGITATPICAACLQPLQPFKVFVVANRPDRLCESCYQSQLHQIALLDSNSQFHL